MELFYLSTIRTDSIPIFVNNWCSVYRFPDQTEYHHALDSLGKNESSLPFLLEWNFQVSRSKKKSDLAQLLQTMLPGLLEWKGEPSALFSMLGEFPAEWKIFTAHILRPKSFPLLHPFTIAAYEYLSQTTISRRRKEKFYLSEFLPYIRKEFYDIPLRKTDQGLFAFGKFIKESGSPQH